MTALGVGEERSRDERAPPRTAAGSRILSLPSSARVGASRPGSLLDPRPLVVAGLEKIDPDRSRFERARSGVDGDHVSTPTSAPPSGHHQRPTAVRSPRATRPGVRPEQGGECRPRAARQGGRHALLQEGQRTAPGALRLPGASLDGGALGRPPVASRARTAGTTLSAPEDHGAAKPQQEGRARVEIQAAAVRRLNAGAQTDPGVGGSPSGSGIGQHTVTAQALGVERTGQTAEPRRLTRHAVRVTDRSRAAL